MTKNEYSNAQAGRTLTGAWIEATDAVDEDMKQKWSHPHGCVD